MRKSMKTPDLILWFRNLRKENIPLAGGKCTKLGEVPGRLSILGLDMESVIKTIQKGFI